MNGKVFKIAFTVLSIVGIAGLVAFTKLEVATIVAIGTGIGSALASVLSSFISK